MYNVLNTLSEYTYFYISKNITSYTFLLVLKIDESLHCILKNKYNFTSSKSISYWLSINLNRSKQYIFKYINQSKSIKTIYFQIYLICSIKWGWLGPMFGIFNDLLTHCNHSNTWHPEYMKYCPHSPDYKNTWSLINHVPTLFSLQTRVVISEMGRLGRLLDLKLMSFFFLLYSHIIADIKYETIKA